MANNLAQSNQHLTELLIHAHQGHRESYREFLRLVDGFALEQSKKLSKDGQPNQGSADKVLRTVHRAAATYVPGKRTHIWLQAIINEVLS